MRILCNYSSINSTFSSTRDDAIDAAEALFGSTSCEAMTVRNAWAAVGVGDPYTPSTPSTPSGPSGIENGDHETYTTTSGGTQYQWYLSGDDDFAFTDCSSVFSKYTTTNSVVVYNCDEEYSDYCQLKVRVKDSCGNWSGWSSIKTILED